MSMKKIKNILAFALLAVFMTGCADYLDVNNNVDAPDKVAAHLLLAPIQANLQGYYWDIRGIGPLTQMMSTTGYTNYARHGYNKGSDACGEVWRMTYWLHGKNLENLITQSEEIEEWNMAGIGYAIKALSWDFLDKEHADLPMKEAFVPGLLQHNYDYQKDIFPQIRAWAYKAIEYFDKGDPTTYGERLSDWDYIYHGDMSKWKKFAYAVLARNYIAMSQKDNFASAYADSVIYCVNNSFSNTDDDATLEVEGDVTTSATCNFWGVTRGNLGRVYVPSDYVVQIMTGVIPYIDPATGRWVTDTDEDGVAHTKLLEPQILADTLVDLPGHFDPRTVLLIGTADTCCLDDLDKIKHYRFAGGSINSTSGTNPRGGTWTAPSFYGRVVSPSITKDGTGRWIYRDDAPYIIMTYAEMQFIKAEAYWKKGDIAAAYEAFKTGVSASMDMVEKYIHPAADGDVGNGDKISPAAFRTLANEYLAGPYVNGLGASNLTLSHIMMQKYVALYPWGAQEVWVDLRKYLYDLANVTISNGLPSGGYDILEAYHKSNEDPTRIYKGFFLPSAQVQTRGSQLYVDNEGAPCFRIRPRYNSEYMWNMPSLQKLAPIAGDAPNYQCSIPWFAIPNE